MREGGGKCGIDCGVGGVVVVVAVQFKYNATIA